MNTLRKALVATCTLVLLFVLAIAPAGATESHDEDESDKITLPETQRDLIGLPILGLAGLATLAALANARKQLRGERDQATGDFRWR